MIADLCHLGNCCENIRPKPIGIIRGDALALLYIRGDLLEALGNRITVIDNAFFHDRIIDGGNLFWRHKVTADLHMAERRKPDGKTVDDQPENFEVFARIERAAGLIVNGDVESAHDIGVEDVVQDDLEKVFNIAVVIVFGGQCIQIFGRLEKVGPGFEDHVRQLYYRFGLVRKGHIQPPIQCQTLLNFVGYLPKKLYPIN